MDEPFHNKLLHAAFHEKFDNLSHTIQLRLAGTGGGTFAWEFAHPGKLLAALVHEGVPLQRVFAPAAAANPPSMQRPCSLILAWDEFAPGNKLKADNRRKCMALSFSSLELGQSALFHEWAWVTAVCIRSSQLGKVEGGWAGALRQFLHTLLLGPLGMATGGVPLEIGGSPIMLFAKVTNMLSDGDGLREAFDLNGASGLKPCLKHWNVWKMALTLLIDEKGTLRSLAQTLDSSRLGQLRKHTLRWAFSLQASTVPQAGI